MCPQYMNERNLEKQNNIITINFSLKLFQPLRTKALSQKCLSYLDDFKLSSNANIFKHKGKRAS